MKSLKKKSVFYQAIFCLIFSSVLSNVSAQGWSTRRLADMPMAVTNNAVVEGYLTNGDTCVYSFGGIDSTLLWSGITTNAFRYHLSTDTWDTIPSLPDTLGKIASAATRIKDTIYIIGGYHVLQNTNEISSNKVHRYVTTTNSYLPDGATVPFPIDDQVQCKWRDSLIYVISGWSNSGNIANVQVYDPRLNSWQQATPVPNNNQYKVFGGSGMILKDTIYYYGGATTSSNFPATQIIRKGVIDPLNPLNIIWSLITTNQGFNGYRTACVLDNGGWIEWIGGSEVSYNYDGIAYSGIGAVSISDIVRIYIPFTPQVGFCYMFDSIPMDLRGVATIKDHIFQNSNYIIAGGMWSEQKVSNQTLLLDWEWKGAVQENYFGNSVKVYPNPVSDQLHVNFEESPGDDVEIEIIDCQGRTIIVSSVAQTNLISTNHLEDGYYFLQIRSSAGNSCIPIIIQH